MLKIRSKFSSLSVRTKRARRDRDKLASPRRCATGRRDTEMKFYTCGKLEQTRHIFTHPNPVPIITPYTIPPIVAGAEKLAIVAYCVWLSVGVGVVFPHRLFSFPVGWTEKLWIFLRTIYFSRTIARKGKPVPPALSLSQSKTNDREHLCPYARIMMFSFLRKFPLRLVALAFLSVWKRLFTLARLKHK